MKPIHTTTRNAFFTAVVIACSLSLAPAHGQFFKKLQQKLEDKANAKADDIMNGKKKQSGTANDSSTGNTGGGKKLDGKLPYEEEVSTFAAGTRLYYADDLANESVGRMPGYWKTHSTGSVAVIPDVPGKWLKMSSNSTYRLDTLLPMPKKFTMEFDLLTRSEEADDLNSITFGFNSDNNANNYIYGVSSTTSAYSKLEYDYNHISNTSNETRTNNRLEFPMKNFGNAVMHISIVVENEHMRMYFNRCKMLDSDMFERTTAKYFFISTEDLEHKANVYISNMRIMEL
ncbi:hypothetical protein HNQ91_004560 [Filimonas zeae]|uniref:Uncharacterized protein n=1 Tax=Filimonas zeae TaxID=1737353 RepID=A0A917J147_9BACT|nr:hypothetical protein [Filimonas zeae]MDR6341487.1 hypothetical protein [Filimonas zeae]GGH75633.1 hypothetical protein GCM10011379_39400 [Filimonas zeae]